MSVDAVAGISGVRLSVLKMLKTLARIYSCAYSPNLNALPKVMSTDEYPGPVKMFRHLHPGPRVVVSNEAVGLGKTPLIHCCLEGFVITPPL